MWNVLEQRIPVPHILNDANLTDPGYIPSIEGLDGAFADLKRYGDYRAYPIDDSISVDTDQMHSNSRLVGRSVWNTRWLLIIPGVSLHSDADYGLDQFIEHVDDIKLIFETYSHEGN